MDGLGCGFTSNLVPYDIAANHIHRFHVLLYLLKFWVEQFLVLLDNLDLGSNYSSLI